LVPINKRCSLGISWRSRNGKRVKAYQKWAQPGRLSGSLKCPTPTSILAAALSAFGSETTMTSKPLGRVRYLCSRSSVGGRMRSTDPEATGMGGQGGKGDAIIGSSGSKMGWEVFEGFCDVLDIRYAIIDTSKLR
jgi:hypothetical protein